MKNTLKITSILAGFTVLAPAGEPAPKVAKTYSRAAAKKDYMRPVTLRYPPDNVPSVDRQALGKSLFFDPRLSASNWIACSTCHNPGLSWGDGLPKGIGHGMKNLGRRTPTVLNLAWADLLFWDGRSPSLEDQALGPMQAPGEMNNKLTDVVNTVRSIPGYKSMFAKAYPGEQINGTTIGKAIANYERTLVSAAAPFDYWIEGDETAISEEAKTGFDLFNTKGECAACHTGWNFTDHGFHDIGVPGDDLGRGKLLNLEAMQHAFKTPTLRNADHRAPYLHDGSEPTLESVIDFYDAGGKAARPSLSPEIHKLNLTPDEKRALAEFLKTLTSVDKPVEFPVLPR